jgi:hypothetical protein
VRSFAALVHPRAVLPGCREHSEPKRYRIPPKDTKAVILPELVLMTSLIPYFKMGKAVRFRVADVAQAIERMRIG